MKATKVCTKCKQELPMGNFRIVSKGKRYKRDGSPRKQSYGPLCVCTQCQSIIGIESNKRHPERYRARIAVHTAVKKGVLKKLPCRVCGAEKVEGHHTDYSQALSVIWLCRKHHMEVEYGKLTI